MTLRDLRDKVAAGTPEAWEIAAAFEGWGDYDEQIALVPLFRYACDNDDLRAVGSALALVKELLPGCIAGCNTDGHGDIIGPKGLFYDFGIVERFVEDNPARALILALLDAMIGANATEPPL